MALYPCPQNRPITKGKRRIPQSFDVEAETQTVPFLATNRVEKKPTGEDQGFLR
jgi:hypothetical protein